MSRRFETYFEILPLTWPKFSMCMKKLSMDDWIIPPAVSLSSNWNYERSLCLGFQTNINNDRMSIMLGRYRNRSKCLKYVFE